MGSFAQMMDPHAWVTMFMSGWSDMDKPSFWVALGNIMFINVLLSGDNAVVIAMACLGLPKRQRLWGMVFGAGVAVILRIVFTVVIAQLMLLPYLKLIGGLALFYIAAKLLVPEDEDDGGVEAVDHLWRAVRIIAVADIVMSLDNIIAIAAAAQKQFRAHSHWSRHQRAADRGGRGTDHGPARTLPDPGLGRRGAARLDRRPGRLSTDPAVALLYLVPEIRHRGRRTTSKSRRVSSAQILVVVVGGLWRRSKQQASADKVSAAE